MTPILLAWLSILPVQEQDRGRITPEEIARRRKEALEDAKKAYANFKSWTAKVKWFVSDPARDQTLFYQGDLWIKVKETDGKVERLLSWRVNESEDQTMKRVMGKARTLYKGVEIKETAERSSLNMVWTYDLSEGEWFLPQMLLRDGFVADLEELFTIDILANARYMKTEPDANDWKALGFKDQTDMDKWWKSKKAEGSGGSRAPGNLKEDRPFKDREDEFDRKNKRNTPVETSGAVDWKKYYIIILRPKTRALKRKIDHIRVTYRPGDFLPLSMTFAMTNDQYRTFQIEEIKKDPEPEIPDEKFVLDTTGYREMRPR